MMTEIEQAILRCGGSRYCILTGSGYQALDLLLSACDIDTYGPISVSAFSPAYIADCLTQRGYDIYIVDDVRCPRGIGYISCHSFGVSHYIAYPNIMICGTETFGCHRESGFVYFYSLNSNNLFLKGIGGCIVLDDNELYNSMLDLREQNPEKYGYCSAVIPTGLDQLTSLYDRIRARDVLVDNYTHAFAGMGYKIDRLFFSINNYTYVCRVVNKSMLVNRLLAEGINIDIVEPLYRNIKYKRKVKDYPISERIRRYVVAFPLDINENQQNKIINITREVLCGKKRKK